MTAMILKKLWKHNFGCVTFESSRAGVLAPGAGELWQTREQRLACQPETYTAEYAASR